MRFIITIFVLIITNLVYSETVDELKPVGFVSDFANILSSESYQKMKIITTELEQKTSSEIAIVTVKNIDSASIEDFTVKLFEKWEIGKKGKDNGVLFLTSVEDRKVWIEVGYGLEGILPDGLCGEILDKYVIPYFKQGDYSKGIIMGIAAITSIIAKDSNVELTGTIIPVSGKRKQSLVKIIFNALFFLVLIFVFIKHPFLFLFFLGTGGFRGGSFGRGGFSGGFGGFGGGLSGGGGASRGW